MCLALARCADEPHIDPGADTRDSGAEVGAPLPTRDSGTIVASDAGPSPNRCIVGDEDLDAPPTCSETALPGSFEPEIQWVWTGPEDEVDCVVTPLVANLTDDNGDGLIDLCDVPDVVVVTTFGSTGHINLLNGLTGELELRFEDAAVNGVFVTPALGDIDGDGVPEIVAAEAWSDWLIAFEHDGTVKWRTRVAVWEAIALADVDADGDVEILGSNGFGVWLVDHDGNLLWSHRTSATRGNVQGPTAADLDGDGLLEIVTGRTAYHPDGSIYYENAAVPEVHPLVANLDADPEPEILGSGSGEIVMLEHDGTRKWSLPGDDWAQRPATVHNFGGDGAAEFAVTMDGQYTTYHGDGTILWSATVLAGQPSTSTAFDFLGDGTAEALVYGGAPGTSLLAFDSAGRPVFQVQGGYQWAYPVVADVDNDGSAEIVVISGFDYSRVPTVQVFRDREDRWIQARRIWNQDTYHVTNVREDGTIPQHEVRSWTHLNTFRTNAQIVDNRVCEPQIF